MQNVMGYNQNMMGGMSNMGFMPGMQNNGGLDGANGHTTGPIRRGGGRFNNRNNPYDRNNRNGNMNRGFGNLPPGMMGNRMGFIAQGGGGQGGKWGDGAGGGVNAIGPREAVQGRSLRSYEDLDAMPAGGGNNNNAAGAAAAANAAGGGELDY